MEDRVAPRCLGLVGGLGVGATVHYYQALAKAHEMRGSVLNLVMMHADVQRVLGNVSAGETIHLAQYLAGLIRRMASAGAEFAVIPAVTPHICARELDELSPIPVVNLIEAMARETQARGLRRVSIFGTRFAIESRMFGQMPQLEIVIPRAVEVDLIHNTIWRWPARGVVLRTSTSGYARLRWI